MDTILFFVVKAVTLRSKIGDGRCSASNKPYFLRTKKHSQIKNVRQPMG